MHCFSRFIKGSMRSKPPVSGTKRRTNGLLERQAVVLENLVNLFRYGAATLYHANSLTVVRRRITVRNTNQSPSSDYILSDFVFTPSYTDSIPIWL